MGSSESVCVAQRTQSPQKKVRHADCVRMQLCVLTARCPLYSSTPVCKYLDRPASACGAGVCAGSSGGHGAGVRSTRLKSVPC